MNETGSSALDLDLRLTKAQELIARGKQRRALDELWEAEALARGRADAIREMLDFTSAFEQRVEPRQKSRLADLVAALQHDAEMASRAPVAARAVPESTQTERSGTAFYLRLFLSLVLAAGVAALILLYWLVSATTCPCSKQDFLCIFGDPATSGAGAHLAGVGMGLLYGGIGLLILSGYLVYRLRTRLHLPFMSLIVGFPVLYGCLLASIWGVARGIWGPTRC
jgi:hypothetical protein